MVYWASGSKKSRKSKKKSKMWEKPLDKLTDGQTSDNRWSEISFKWTRNDTCTCKEIYNNKISANVIFTLVRLVNSL